MNDSKALIQYSNDMQDVYKYIEEYKSSRKCNVLIIFDDMIADNSAGKKLHISTVFIR